MKTQYEILMAGSGGQGLVSCGIILAEAAMLEGRNVVQTQSYGIASRGGMSKSEVIISKEEIKFQQVQKADILLLLTQKAMDTYGKGQVAIPVIYDTTLIEEVRDQHYYGYPFTNLANELGNVGSANIIALGVMAKLIGVVKPESLRETLNDKFSGKTETLNQKALAMGVELAERRGAF